MVQSKFFTEESMDFLEKYLNTSSPTGYEMEGQKVWTKYIQPYVDEVRSDNYGTAYGVINPEAKYKVVLEAHADEISWYVNYISKEGMIYVIRNGGSDAVIAPSKRVNIHTKKGIVKGVFGWPAIHTRINGKDELPELDTIWIDCGVSSKRKLKLWVFMWVVWLLILMNLWC